MTERASNESDDEPMKVTASLPMVAMEFFESQGMEHAELLRIAALTPEELSDPDSLVDYEALIRLWTEALRRFPDRPLGVSYAEHLSHHTLGLVGYACRHSRDVQQMLELFIRYVHLVDPWFHADLQVEAADARLVIDHDPRVVAMREPLEAFVVSIARSIQPRDGSSAILSEICFDHARRHPAGLYERALPGPVVCFDMGWTGFRFDARALGEPVHDSDPQLGKYLSEQLESAARARAVPSRAVTLDAKVRAAIDQGLMVGTIDQASVARAMAMSTRSLQRGLRELGTSFSDQLDEVRRRRALQLLRRPRVSVGEIAFSLGYGDQRSFYRSFRRWTGTTPGAYRRQSQDEHGPSEHIGSTRTQ